MGDHTETFQVDYDPDRISYGDLLAIFWESHVPTISTTSIQYRSVLLYHDEEQRVAAEASRAALEGELGEQVVTPIEPLGTFTRAEDYHQKYYLRGSGAVYEELSGCFDNDQEFVDSTTSARLNGYFGGHGTLEQFEQERDLYGLSEQALSIVHEHVEAVEGKCDVE
jgi:hypothetical protein